MSRVIDERDALIDLLESTLGGLVQIVTTDEAEARPAPGKVAVFIEPPDLAYPDWTGEPTITWRLDVIAGTTATQPAALPSIIDAIDALAGARLNIARAEPVTFTAGGTAKLAAYQVTLNPLEIIEEE
jgi:hypothetical protein